MINSLDLIKDLEAVGIPRAHAEAQVSMTMDAFNKTVAVARLELEKAQVEVARYKLLATEQEFEIANLKRELEVARRRIG